MGCTAGNNKSHFFFFARSVCAYYLQYQYVRAHDEWNDPVRLTRGVCAVSILYDIIIIIMTRECIIHCNVQYRTRYQYIYNIYCASDATGPSTQFSPGQIVSNHFNYYIRIICYIIQYRVCMCVFTMSALRDTGRNPLCLMYLNIYIIYVCAVVTATYTYLPSRYRVTVDEKSHLLWFIFVFFDVWK